MTLYIPVGIPGCGKSTYGSRFGDAVISPDYFRELLTGDKANQQVNGKAWELTREIATTRLSYGLDVYLDATNLVLSWYDKILKHAEFCRQPVTHLIFQVPHEVSKTRNVQRAVPVPDHVMEKMIKRFDALNVNELRTFGEVLYIH